MRASLGCAPLCCIKAVAPLPGQQTPAPLGAPGIYLVLLRRSRFDDLPTGLFNIRGKL